MPQVPELEERGSTATADAPRLPRHARADALPEPRPPRVRSVRSASDTVPIRADWSTYGRHAAPVVVEPRPAVIASVTSTGGRHAARQGARPAPPTTATRLVAATALAAPLLESATARLRSQLRARLEGAGTTGPIDWSRLVVTGPLESADAAGRVWFWYRGTLDPSAPGRRAAEQSAPRWTVRAVPRTPDDAWSWVLDGGAAVAVVRHELTARLRAATEAGRGTEESAVDLILATEELASNALRHGRTPVRVVVGRSADGWLLVVDDRAPLRPPVPAVDRDPALGGMGLIMVAGMSLRCGWQPYADRKSVWAELPADS